MSFFSVISVFEDEVWAQWMLAVAGALFFFLVFSALRKLVGRRLSTWAEMVKIPWLEPLVKAVELPSRVAVSGLAILVGLQLAPFSGRPEFIVNSISKISIVLLGFWMIDRAISVLVTNFNPNARSIAVTLIRLAVLSILLLVVLDTLGVAITPILASLGVGSIAVGLALQDTLSNFFSGIYLLVDRPIREGNFVKIGDFVEGYVKSIGWRSTHVELTTHSTVVIPNSKLASTPVTNYHLPDPECSFQIPMGVALDSDLTRVEQVTVAVAREVLNTVRGGVPGFEPVMRYVEFGEFRVNFFVVLRVQIYTDTAFVRHEFIKALHQRFRQEGISIALPQRVIQSLPLISESLLTRIPDTIDAGNASE